MSIEATYKKLYTEDYVKDRLSRGITVSAQDVMDQIEIELAALDLTIPQFTSSLYQVERLSTSSASLFQDTFMAIRQDLRVLYKELINLANVNGIAFERWDLESNNIEKKLIDLEERIENLLLLTQDTEGYHSILIDNFTDTAFVDLRNTTAEIDLQSTTIEMGTKDTGGVTRIFLNDLNVVDDVTFKVRSTVNMISRIDAVNSSLANIFHQESKTWWASVNMKTQKSVTCELNVRLSPAGPVDISRIFIELHDSAESSPIYITPLYSTDNVNFNQLPTNTYTMEARTTAVFSFSQVSAKYIKFILTKRGPDPSSGQDFFSYQFGFKSIQFFEQGFDVDNPSIMITTPLFITTATGSIKEFEKLTLETCERVETDTSINFYITASNDADLSLDSNLEPLGGTWVPISPLQRTNKLYPTILNVGDIIETTIGNTELETVDDEIVTISYNGRSIDSDYVNPDANFNLLSRDPSSGIVLQGIRAASMTPRYAFAGSNERLLNYQIKITDSGTTGSTLNIDEDNLVLFRNVGKKGFKLNSVNNLVRNIQRGWLFEDPYYSCVVEVQNPDGVSIDVGDSNIIIDDTIYSNLVDNTVLTGKSGILGDTDKDSGVHTVKVHKDNWREVAPDLNSLAELKDADSLYPYNHKMLIEGYAYGTTYLDTEEKVYPGMDMFAEYVMTKISIFDLVNNLANDRYDVYALDIDAPKSHDVPYDNNDPTKVIVVQIDENNPDSKNERFVLRFNLINELRKYLRLRADLITEDKQVTPALHSYKIKLG